MPTGIHDVHHNWFVYTRCLWAREGIMNKAEDRLIDFGVGTSMLFTLQFSLSILILGYSF